MKNAYRLAGYFFFAGKSVRREVIKLLNVFASSRLPFFCGEDGEAVTEKCLPSLRLPGTSFLPGSR